MTFKELATRCCVLRTMDVSDAARNRCVPQQDSNMQAYGLSIVRCLDTALLPLSKSQEHASAPDVLLLLVRQGKQCCV